MEPKIVHEFEKSFFFGLVSVRYILEDRRPDLTEDEARKTYNYKYKLMTMFRCFWFRISTINHTYTPGSLFINGKEI